MPCALSVSIGKQKKPIMILFQCHPGRDRRAVSRVPYPTLVKLELEGDLSELVCNGRCHLLEAGFWPLWMTPLPRYSSHQSPV
jgi:hypothetical protein